MLITADGRHGRMAEVLAAGGPGVFHTHWQTIFSGGRRIGLDALREVVRRVADHFGDRVVWTRCSDLAAYAAASAAVEVAAQTSHDGGAVLRVTSPFASSLFTLSVALEGEARSVLLDGRQLREVAISGSLHEGDYAVAGGRIYLCWALRAQHEIRIERA